MITQPPSGWRDCVVELWSRYVLGPARRL